MISRKVFLLLLASIFSLVSGCVSQKDVTQSDFALRYGGLGRWYSLRSESNLVYNPEAGMLMITPAEFALKWNSRQVGKLSAGTSLVCNRIILLEVPKYYLHDYFKIGMIMEGPYKGKEVNMTASNIWTESNVIVPSKNPSGDSGELETGVQ